MDSSKKESSWLKCDLHVHSPLDQSKSFPETIKYAEQAFQNGKNDKYREIAKKFLNNCKTPDGDFLDLIALTDHNNVRGYKRLSPHFEDLLKEEDKFPQVLPGVEVSVGSERTIHFLVIFEQGISASEIEKFLTHIFSKQKRFEEGRKNPIPAHMSLSDFLEKASGWLNPKTESRNIPSLVIPAHSDSSSGIYEAMKGKLREMAIPEFTWDGFETNKNFGELHIGFQELIQKWAMLRQYGIKWENSTEKQKRRIKNKDDWPLICSSDSKNYEDIGSNFTWIKMANPGIEGLRLGLLDPESRLRRDVKDKPTPKGPKIDKVKISKTDFIDDLEITFHESLNTLIGGRGTGKSTILELLRYTFHRDLSEDFEKKEKNIEENIEDLLKEKNKRDYGDTKGILLPDHEIEVILVVENVKYKIIRNKEETKILKQNHSGNFVQNKEINIRTLFKPKIISQGQIAHIAEDPKAQLREIDSVILSDFNFSDKKEQILNDLNQLQDKRRKKRDKCEALDKKKTELQKLKDKLNAIEDTGNKNVIKKLNTLKEEKGVLDSLKENSKKYAKEIKKICDTLESAKKDRRDKINEYNKDTLTNLIEEFVSQIETSIEKLEEEKTRFENFTLKVKQDINNRWKPAYEEAQSRFSEISEEISDPDFTLEKHEKLVEKRQKLKKETDEIKEDCSEIDDLNIKIGSTLKELRQLHGRRYKSRREVSQTIEEQSEEVEVTIFPFGDKKGFIAKQEEWFSRTGLREKDWKKIGDFIFQPLSSYKDKSSENSKNNNKKSKKDIGKEILKRLKKFKKAFRKDYNFTKYNKKLPEDSKVVNLINKNDNSEKDSSLSGHFISIFDEPSRISLQELEAYIPDDAVKTKARSIDGHFKPIEQGSLGEKSTAILALLLSVSYQPLILDQPEEDLDNKYIYEVVVDLIRKQKFDRQMIIATHNANIPVNGDAEKIISLNVEEQMCDVSNTGSIDIEEIKQDVSVIMEGSEEAFRLRNERYGF